jgi:hypothetical protein
MKRWTVRGLFLALGLILGATTATFNSAQASTGTIEGRVKSVAADGSEMNFERAPDATIYTVTVDEAERFRVKGTPAEVSLKVEVDDVVNPTRLTRIDGTSVRVSAYARVIAMSGSFAALLLLTMIAAGGNPLRFLVGLDNRYSNSQCQMVLWFGVLAVVYVSAVILRIVYLNWNFVGGVGVTANVIALTGLSALSFGGAKVITTQKASSITQSVSTQSIPAQMLQAPQIVPAKTRAMSPKLLTDLFQNDKGDADFGDFQMILITLAAVAIFLISCFVYLEHLWPDRSVTLPDIDTALLSTFGVGQGAYLLKKAAMKAGDG